MAAKNDGLAAVIFLFHSLFQGGGGEGREIDPDHAVFLGQHEGFGQIVTGNHHTLLLRFLQKGPGALGGGGVVQIKNAQNRFLPHRHVIADV